MPKAIDGECIAQLWHSIGVKRSVQGGDLAGGRRAYDAADNIRTVEHWRSTGWHPIGGLLPLPGSPQGRGWHDAHLPCKTPDTH